MLAHHHNNRLTARATAAAFDSPEGRRASDKIYAKFEKLRKAGKLEYSDRIDFVDQEKRFLLMKDRAKNGPLFKAYREALDSIDQRTL
ncbi:hypothetical protein ARTSIC4J27_254 [Pseudarthrobacter siccitolerans]|uniref:Uncharacterized protein n=1 Tax=Pseudarthrobacter siccitolerans TaxID=861266 RepID=A0A024GWL6_9MICC|nr:hypothetical protein [Pseudarthrobacter siccitolerans]CCQ44330.1 hypothetical protein ARTSIC4J27_254 [Pseudarthrobacter siccitolerans]